MKNFLDDVALDNRMNNRWKIKRVAIELVS
jgi:hypothetical protein